MLKKIISTILVISILAVMFSAVSVSAAATSGSCGPTMSWRVEKGVLSITGTGEMLNFNTTSRPPWHDVRSNITEIIIESGVVSIGNYAFADFSQKLSKVSIPETVVSIGNFAFLNCKTLETTVLPAKLKKIGTGAFKLCSSLNSVTIPTGVDYMGSEAFSGCSLLRTAYISRTLRTIEDKTFYDCRLLEAIILPSSIESIGKEAFAKCGYLKTVSFGTGIKTIATGAFSDCAKLENIKYSGSKDMWDTAVKVEANNEPIVFSHIVYNNTSSDDDVNIMVHLNGEKLSFDQHPLIIDGRTMVPLRAIFEALGAEVIWDDATKTITAKKEKRVVMLEIGKRFITIDGVSKELDVPAQILNNRTLVPIRAVSEAFDCEVGWDGVTQTVIITEK